MGSAPPTSMVSVFDNAASTASSFGGPRRRSASSSSRRAPRSSSIVAAPAVVARGGGRGEGGGRRPAQARAKDSTAVQTKRRGPPEVHTWSEPHASGQRLRTVIEVRRTSRGAGGTSKMRVAVATTRADLRRTRVATRHYVCVGAPSPPPGRGPTARDADGVLPLSNPREAWCADSVDLSRVLAAASSSRSARSESASSNTATTQTTQADQSIMGCGASSGLDESKSSRSSLSRNSTMSMSMGTSAVRAVERARKPRARRSKSRAT